MTMDRFEIAAHFNNNLQKHSQDDGWTEQIGDWALENFVSEDKKKEWIGQAVQEAVPYLVSSLAGGALGAGVSGEGNRLMGGASGAGIGALLTYIMSQDTAAEDEPIGGAFGAAGSAGKHLATHPAQGAAAAYGGSRALGTVVGEDSPASHLRKMKQDPEFLKSKLNRDISGQFGEKAEEKFKRDINKARALKRSGKNLRASRVASKAERGLKPWYKQVFAGGWSPEQTAEDIGSAAKETGSSIKTLARELSRKFS